MLVAIWGCMQAAMSDLVYINWETERSERHRRYARGVEDLAFGNGCCLFAILHIFMFFAVYRDHEFVHNFPLQKRKADTEERSQPSQQSLSH